MYKYFTGTGFGKSLVSSSNANNEIANELNKYRKIIDKYYLGDVDEEKLKEGAIKGYIEGLGDKYSEYISKEDMEDIGQAYILSGKKKIILSDMIETETKIMENIVLKSIKKGMENEEARNQ